MKSALGGRTAVLAALLLGAAPAAAIIVGGGGAKSKDCVLVFDVAANYPATAPRSVRCVDGDPTCDSDGVINGLCSIEVAVCAKSTFDPVCAVSGLNSVDIDHSDDNGDPKFDPDFLALRSRIANEFTYPVTTADTCTSAVVFRVPIKGPLGKNRCSRQKKKLKLHAASNPSPAGVIADADALELSCAPNPLNGCAPQQLYGGTFERIQKQIFNQSCALSGCHDSQSQSGGLLLETGAAYGNLVNQPPANDSAAGAGWLRVDALLSDPDTSFLFHKIDGDLPDPSYGVRMPRNRPKLNKTLRDIIELWIRAGAPQTGWVPETY
ncbi:MAG: hypothetical protein ABI629_16035 [bacterium]